MLENFICECPFCREAAKWPKHNPYSDHNAHEEAVRDALHQAELDNIAKDEIIEYLRKKLAKSEEKHKKATKMVKVLMKERETLMASLHNRIEKVDELLVKNAELKKMNASQRHIIEDSGYISMSEYDNAIKERNVYKSKCTTYEHLYDDVCKKYNELYEKFDKLSNQEKPMYRDSKLHKDNLKTIYKLEEENKEYKELNGNQKTLIDDLRNQVDILEGKLKKEKEDYTIHFEFDKTVGDAIGGYISREKYTELLKENKELKRREISEKSNRQYFQNKFYDKCEECDRLADENKKLSSRIPVILRVENGGIDLQTFVPKSKYDTLEQKYWDDQRLIDKYAQSEEKMKEYLNALTGLYFDECVKTRKDCPLFGGFRGGKIFGDHGNTGESEML